MGNYIATGVGAEVLYFTDERIGTLDYEEECWEWKANKMGREDVYNILVAVALEE